MRHLVINSCIKLFFVSSPYSRDLNGDLQGFKVIVGSFNSSNLWSNFTLDSDVTSLQLDNLTSEEIYWVKIAAYNRKGKVPIALGLYH